MRMKSMRYGVVVVLLMSLIALLHGQEEMPKCYESQKWYVKIPAICQQDSQSMDCLYLFDKAGQKAIYARAQNQTTQNDAQALIFIDTTNPLITYSITPDSNILTQNKKTKNSKKLQEEHYLVEQTSCAYIDGARFSKDWENINTATATQKNTKFRIEKLDTATLRFIIEIGQSPNQQTSSAEFYLKPLSSTQAHIIYAQNTLCKILITKRDGALLIGQFESKGVCEALYGSELSPLATQYELIDQTQK